MKRGFNLQQSLGGAYDRSSKQQQKRPHARPQKGGEDEKNRIIERQRQLASKFRPAAMGSVRNEAVKPMVTKPKAESLAQTPPPPNHKRPRPSGSKKSPISLLSPGTAPNSSRAIMSATDALAASRSRLGIADDNLGKPSTGFKGRNEGKASSTQYARLNGAKKESRGKGALSGMIHTRAKQRGKSSYHKVEEDDFWRNLRNWDLITQLEERSQFKPQNKKQSKQDNNRLKFEHVNSSGVGKVDCSSQKYGEKESGLANSFKNDGSFIEMMKRQQGGGEEEKKSENDNDTTAVPQTFESASHYKSVWSPLCLSECRAQLASEMSATDYFKWNSPVPVSVSGLKRDCGGGGIGDAMTLKIGRKRSSESDRGCDSNRNNTNSKIGDFHLNDIVLFVSNPNVMLNLTHKKRNSNSKPSSKKLSAIYSCSEWRGMVGHVQQSRKTVDGLMVSVSRSVFCDKMCSPSDLYLVKAGSNVTALREFTSLCSVEKTPLLSHLLKTKINIESASSESSTKTKKELLESMGGTNALGLGFTKYAAKKFNTSQLHAISSAAAEYGKEGFTLVKGPPGTGKTTTLVALINSIYIRQINKYFENLRQIATSTDSSNASRGFAAAVKLKPRFLVCAPSNTAVDNIILKIMHDGFVDGNGCRFNPVMVRVGKGQSDDVRDIALEGRVGSLIAESKDIQRIESTIAGIRLELGRIKGDINRLQKRAQAILHAAPWDLSTDWEIRIDESTFDISEKVYFVNHKTKKTTFDIPSAPSSGERKIPARKMPEFRAHVKDLIKFVEMFNKINFTLEQYRLLQTYNKSGSGHGGNESLRGNLETHILDSANIVLTTLGTSGSRVLESTRKFEVVVIDEAAQSVEPSTLAALQLSSSHAILVGDPQQLPATIFSVSGRNTKYDRSLFQRLEESGHAVHLLDTQYRMHPKISDFPRRIFYEGALEDGPNVVHPEYGCPLRREVLSKIPRFQPFTLLDLDSSEERGGMSLSNPSEAKLALHLYKTLDRVTGGMVSKQKVAIITPYAQQMHFLRRTFSSHFGADYISERVSVSTVDAFQGKEANIVIFSCVRANGNGIGFLSDVRRMNVALTRAKHFLFVIARCDSIIVNPYWKDLVTHAMEMKAVIKVPMIRGPSPFPDLTKLSPTTPPRNDYNFQAYDDEHSNEDGKVPFDLKQLSRMASRVQKEKYLQR